MNELIKNAKCVIFDADGTLLDSMPMWNSITYEYGKFKGLDLPEDLSRRMNSMSLRQCAECYVHEYGATGSVEEVSREIVDMARERYRTTVPEKPGALAFLKELHNEGIKTAVATASEPTSLKPAFERLGMLPYIDLFLSCVSLGVTKETPDIYIKCAEHFGLGPHECFVVEDALYAARTAKSADFSVIVMEDKIHEPDKAELKSLADIYTRDLSELI